MTVGLKEDRFKFSLADRFFVMEDYVKAFSPTRVRAGRSASTYKILLLYPEYPETFWSFSHDSKAVPDVTDPL
jgi:hypothetical protein